MRKRNVAILFRLNKKEAEVLDKKVKKSGLNREAYLRQLISGVVPRDAPPPDYYSMMRELHKIGNNLNQIAQKAHVLNVIDAEQEAAEKAKRKKNRQRESNAAHRAKTKAERWAANDGHKSPKRICEQCGKEFYPNSTRQRFCNTDCTKAHQQAEKEKKRFAEKGEHTFRQKVCKICGNPFWPSNGQEVLCSEECKTINRNQRQLAYYHRKQSGQKAGEAI